MYQSLLKSDKKFACLNKQKRIQLISNNEIDWSLHENLPSHLKDFAIKTDCSSLYTRKRIFDIFMSNANVENNLCTICSLPASHDHIFNSCKIAQKIQYDFDLWKTKNMIIDTSSYRCLINKSIGIQNNNCNPSYLIKKFKTNYIKWLAHCTINWNDLKNEQDLWNHKIFKITYDKYLQFLIS